MRNIFLVLGILAIAVNSIAVGLTIKTLYKDPTISLEDWVKADHWICKDNITWFKYDKETGKLWKSTNNGKKWKESEDGMWNNAEGKFLKISYGKVVWTTDSTQPWNEVPEWKWQGGDGQWYKFDREWNLWVYKK